MTTIELIEPDPVFRDKARLKTVKTAPDASAPKAQDVVQGAIANCPIAATMTALAHATPKKVTAMLGPANKVNVLSKRRNEDKFSHKSSFCYSVKFHGNSKKVQISPVLYFAGSDVQYAGSPGGVGWPSYIEKAYAVWRGRGSYSRLEGESSLVDPPSANQVMKDCVGRIDYVDLENSHFYPDKGGDEPLKVRKLVDLLGKAASQPTIAASHPNNAKKYKIINFHGYAVMRITKKSMVHLRNPHGGSGADVQISLKDFQSAFIAVLQAAK